jgi:hypothetical protein
MADAVDLPTPRALGSLRPSGKDSRGYLSLLPALWMPLALERSLPSISLHRAIRLIWRADSPEEPARERQAGTAGNPSTALWRNLPSSMRTPATDKPCYGDRDPLMCHREQRPVFTVQHATPHS